MTASLKQRLVDALVYTPTTGETYKPGHERFDRHKTSIDGGHKYLHNCALCTGDVDALVRVLIGVFTDELKADWSRYRGRVLQEAWEALRDVEDGPLIDGMRVVNDLLDKQLAGEPSLAALARVRNAVEAGLPSGASVPGEWENGWDAAMDAVTRALEAQPEEQS